jgi:hypothetical protein
MAFSRLSFIMRSAEFCAMQQTGRRNIIDVLAHGLFDAGHMRSVSMAEQVIEFIPHGTVAFASRIFEAGPIYDSHMTTPVFDQTGLP